MIYECPNCKYPLEKGIVLCPMCGALLELGAQGFLQKGILCFACGYENERSGEIYCPNCGKKYSIECPNCKKETDLKSAFCSNCGYDLNLDRQKAKDVFEQSSKKPIAPPSIRVSLVILTIGVIVAISAIFLAPKSLGHQLSLLAFAIVFGALFALAMHLPFFSKKPKRVGKYQEVYSSINPFLAEHVRTILEHEGIEAFIYNRYSVALAPFDPKGARVLVPKIKVEQAERILKDFGLI